MATPDQLIAPPDHVKSLYLTAGGHDLLEDRPEAFETFFEIAEPLTTPQRFRHAGAAATQATLIDSGCYGRVYELPGHEDLCVKVVSPFTLSQRGLTQTVPNLKTEAKFMDAVDRRLQKRAVEDIRVPAQFAVAKFAVGSALLQERIPRDYRTISALIDSAEDKDLKTHFKNRGFATVRRVTELLKRSGFGLNMIDLGFGQEQFNGKNILIDGAKPASESPSYVIDLVGPRRSHHAAAAFAAKFGL